MSHGTSERAPGVAHFAIPAVGIEPTRGYPQRILSPQRLPYAWHWADVGVAFKSLVCKPVTSLTFMGLIAAALRLHGQSSYQILTKSGGSPSYTRGPRLDDPPVPTAGGRAAGLSLHRRRAALSDLLPPRPCHGDHAGDRGPSTTVAGGWFEPTGGRRGAGPQARHAPQGDSAGRLIRPCPQEPGEPIPENTPGPLQPAATDKSTRAALDAVAEMGTACTRPNERVLAAIGLLNGASTRFETCHDVSLGGCCVPCRP